MPSFEKTFLTTYRDGAPMQCQQTVRLLRRPEEGPPARGEVVDLEDEPVVHGRIAHEPGRGERVGEGPVKVEVPGARPRCGRHEQEQRFRLPLLELHLGRALDGVGRKFPVNAVEPHPLRDPIARQEDLVCQAANLLVAGALRVGHHELEAVAAAGDERVDQQSALLLLQALRRLLEQAGVDPGWTREGPDTGPDNGNGGLHPLTKEYVPHAGYSPFPCGSDENPKQGRPLLRGRLTGSRT